MKTVISKIIFTTIIVIGSVVIAQAQIFPPPQPQNNTNIPLDPLSWTLLAAGGGVAAKKYYDKRKNNNNKEEE